jgi:hypothetical protein
MIQIDKQMPGGCDVCPLMYDYIQCNALPEGCKDDDAFNEEGFDWTNRPKWCPLKEQDAKPLRCKTCTMRDKTGFCHRWNREVKDDDYCSFGEWKGC